MSERRVHPSPNSSTTTLDFFFTQLGSLLRSSTRRILNVFIGYINTREYRRMPPRPVFLRSEIPW